MNVLHLVESLDRGGLERVVIDLALAQRAAGYQVGVSCLFHEGQLATELHHAGVIVSCVGKRPGLDIRAVRRLSAVIHSSGANVLHTHNATANYYGALAAMTHPRLRLVNSRHGMGSASKDAFKEKLYRLSLMRTAAVAVVCNRAAEHFAEQGIVPRSLMRVVYNGIRLDRFAPLSSEARGAVRARFAIGDDALVIGSVGRLNWAKDQSMLIKSFARMRSRRSNDRLVIVGEGELRPRLEAEIAELKLDQSVLLLGDRSDVPEILTIFDMFVATSVTEGYSIALLEAAAAGIPVIASDVGGNAEVVQHGRTGIIVKSRTAESFATALDDLASDSGRRAQMARSAREWAEAYAGLEQAVRGYEQVYLPASDMTASRSRAQ